MSMYWKIQHSKDINCLLIFSFSAIPMKIPARIFADINKFITKFIWKGKKSLSHFEKEKNGITLPDFKTYCINIVSKQCGICQRIETKINKTERRTQK